MKKYIRPEIAVYCPETEMPLLAGSANGTEIKGTLPNNDESGTGEYEGFSKEHKVFSVWDAWEK